MLTVRRYDANGETVEEAQKVRYHLNFYGDPFEAGFELMGDERYFIPTAPALIIDDGKVKRIFQYGRFFVMNEAGKTIAIYKLKNDGIPKSDGPQDGRMRQLLDDAALRAENRPTLEELEVEAERHRHRALSGSDAIR
jgi:hypothetical protein